MILLWTLSAQKSFDHIVEYLKEECSTNTAVNFVQKTNHFIETLKEHPRIGKPVKIKKD
ncbi:MAG: type II toxin-antitoxin system RelE/ParE family toxin [Bacteroidales bacterium]|nr:type II toxin-antitoxin system RelE/ParE family toxin [Bacteroidales bacterium]